MSAIRAGAFASVDMPTEGSDASGLGSSYYEHGWVVDTPRGCGVGFKKLLSAYEELLRQRERKGMTDRQLHLYRALVAMLR